MGIERPLVTIFETYGAGAAEIGPAVAEALGVPWVSQAFSSEDLEAAEGGPVEEDSLLSRVLTSLGRTAASADVGVFGGHLDMLDAEEAEENARTLRAQVADGAVVLGRNGTVILADEPLALHVKLDGPPDARVERGARLAGISLSRARSRQSREDAARAALCQRLFHWDPRHNDHYDLVLNTTRLDSRVVVDTILAAYRLKTSRPA